MLAGLVVSVTALIALVADHAFIMDGPDVVGFRSTPFTWTMVGIGAAGVLLVIGGAIGQFVAWIGAYPTIAFRLTRRPDTPSNVSPRGRENSCAGAECRSNAGIAGELNIGERTVEAASAQPFRRLCIELRLIKGQ